MQPFVDELTAAIRVAAQAGTPLCIRAGGTKDFYGGSLCGAPLDVSANRGIVAYEPTELVLTARAGTLLSEIEHVLGHEGQMLAFEPPSFGGAATLGGCIAAGLSGPRRAHAGAVRDFMLGARLLDGRGNDLTFGGQVMKNVAGFDVARLLAGSLGTLGVILEASLKVLPKPAAEATVRFERTADASIAAMNTWSAQPLPISATSWLDGELSVRVSGAQAGVDAALERLGGERMPAQHGTTHWMSLREQTAPFFKTNGALWRLSVKSTAPMITLSGPQLIEWGGALRWILTDAEPASVRAQARLAGGHATLYRSSDKAHGVFEPLAPALMNLHRNLKRTFDPCGIFNRGRLYPEF